MVTWRVLFTFIYLSAFLFFACSNSTEPEEQPDLEDQLEHIVNTDEEKLLLIDHIPLDLTYYQVKEILPDLSEPIVESEYFSILERATINTNLFSHDCNLEFNFSNDTLYAYWYNIDNLSNGVADSLYTYLQSFYGEIYGDYFEEISHDPGASGYPIFWGSYWDSDEYEVVIGNNIYANYCLLAFGFQERINFKK